MTNNFIILRGPSGSGKTSVARVLFDQATERTVLINQDYYRFIFNPAGAGSKPNSDTIHKMIEHNCITALEDGYDVILEGILSVKSYSEILDRIIKRHKGQSYMFYFDVSFEETARRHKNRIENTEYSVEDMREWYDSAHRSNHKLELLISEMFSINESVSFIHEAISVKHQELHQSNDKFQQT